MPNTPRRAWLQIHLSTAVVLMFAAGGLIWANVNAGRMRCGMIFRLGVGFHSEFYVRNLYGWPFQFMTGDSYTVDARLPNPPPLDIPNIEFVASLLIADVTIALVLLAGVWLLCERWIAWRKKRLTSSSP